MANFNENTNYWPPGDGYGDGTYPINQDPSSQLGYDHSGYNAPGSAYGLPPQQQNAYHIPPQQQYARNDGSIPNDFQMADSTYGFVGMQQPVYGGMQHLGAQNGILHTPAPPTGYNGSYNQGYEQYGNSYQPLNYQNQPDAGSWMAQGPSNFHQPIGPELAYPGELVPPETAGSRPPHIANSAEAVVTDSDEGQDKVHMSNTRHADPISTSADFVSPNVPGDAAGPAVQHSTGSTAQYTAGPITQNASENNVFPGLQAYQTAPRTSGNVDKARNRISTGAEFASLGEPSPHQRPANLREADKSVGPATAARFYNLDPNSRLPLAIFQDYSDQINNPETLETLKEELKTVVGGKGLPYEPFEAKLKKLLPKSKTSGEDEEKEDLIVQPPVRPDDPVDAAAWDAEHIVNLELNKDRDAQAIGPAVAEYGTLIKTMAADVAAARKKLTEAGKMEQVAAKNDLATKEQILLRAVDAAVQTGHPQVLANMSGNQKLIVDLAKILISAYKSADWSGLLPKSVFRLMAKFSAINKDSFEKLNLDKVQKRFSTKGDEEMQAIVGDFMKAQMKGETAGKVSKPTGDTPTSTPEPTAPPPSQAKTTEQKTMPPSDSLKKKTGVPAPRPSSDSSPAKRPRDDESDTRVTKKFAVESSTAGTASQTTNKASAPKITPGSANTASTQAKPWSGTALLPGKSRPVAKAVSKSAAAKVDGTTPKPAGTTSADGAKPSQAKSTATKYTLTKAKKIDTSKNEPVRRIAALLESISKPKEIPQQASTPESATDISETPEEKEKRLRKEQRRKLRVNWKEGDALTEVRFYQKDDPEEDERKAGNMLRAANNDRQEGMLLRQDAAKKKAREQQGEAPDEDDEMMEDKDDNDEDDELPYIPWHEPSAIDFSRLPKEQREKTPTTRGGSVVVTTEQQKYIAEREDRELMVVYTDPSDIPSTPRSPPSSSAQAQIQTGPPGVYLPDNTPQLQEIHRRWKDVDQVGVSWARHNALLRAQHPGASGPANVDPATVMNALGSIAASQGHAFAPQHPANSQQQPNMPQRGTEPLSAASKDAQVFALLTSDRVKNWKDPDPYNPSQPKTHRRYDYADPEVQKAADAVENLAEALKGKPYPATEPPAYMKNDQMRTAEWWQGYNQDAQRRSQTNQGDQSRNLSQAPSQAVQAGAQTSQGDNTAAWVAYLTQMSQAQAQAQAQPQAQVQQQDPYSQYYGSLGAQSQAPQQAVHTQASSDTNAQLHVLLAALGGSSQPAQQPPATAAAPMDQNAQLRALLANLGSTSQSSQSSQPSQPSQPYQPYQAAPAMNSSNTTGPNHQAHLQGLNQYSTGQSQTGESQSRGGSAPSRSHDQHSLHDNGYHSGQRSGGRSHNDNSASSSIPPHLRGINRSKIGTKVCTFWLKGDCRKGDTCTYLHSLP